MAFNRQLILVIAASLFLSCAKDRTVDEFNRERELPDSYTRVLIYVGQCLIAEDNGRPD